MVGLVSLKRCQARPLVNMQTQLQWRLGDIGNFKDMRRDQDSGRGGVKAA